MRDYNPNKPSTYSQYLDANNLYGWAMSQPLPTHGFRWKKDLTVDLAVVSLIRIVREDKKDADLFIGRRYIQLKVKELN